MDELIDYFKKNLKKGYTQDSLRWALLNQGYSRIEIDKAIRRVNLELSREAPILESKPIIKHEYITDEMIESAKKKSILKKLFGL